VQGYLSESLFPFVSDQDLEQHISGEPHPDIVDTYWEDEIEPIKQVPKKEARPARKEGDEEKKDADGKSAKDKEDKDEPRFVIKRRSHRFLGREDLSDWGFALEASLTGKSGGRRKGQATEISSSGFDASSKAAADPGISLARDSSSSPPAAQDGVKDRGGTALAKGKRQQDAAAAYDIISVRTGQHPEDASPEEVALGIDLAGEAQELASEGTIGVLKKAMRDAAFQEEVRGLCFVVHLLLTMFCC
jgi:hypothetical protein